MATTSRIQKGARALYLGLTGLALFGLSVWFAEDSSAQVKKTLPPKGTTAPPIGALPKANPGAKTKDLWASTHGGIEQVNYINELVEKQWSENKIRPAERCSDYDFIRRASLDIIGRIATVDEVNRYMRDPESKRRSMLIDRLLDNPEFGDNFANNWTTMLLTRQGSKEVHRDQMHLWIAEQLNNPKTKWTDVVAQLVSAKGATNENQAVNFVLHHMGDEIRNDRENGAWDMVPVTSRTTKLFLGVRTQCVQCHDHPFNGEWTQAHFWQINAFYRQTTSNGRPGMMNAKKKKGIEEKAVYELRDEPDLNSKGLVPYERRSGVLYYARPAFLTGEKADLKASKTRREQLAHFITTSSYFSKAFVNRTWAHFMGKSFTKDAPDDFGDHNPVSNPELLERLAKDWAEKYDHQPKDLIRWICNSRAYGLSSVANDTNDKPEDEIYFARMLLRQMTPEQLFESVVIATEMKAIQGDKKNKRDAKQAWMDQLVNNFGNDEGEEVSFNGTVVQALLLMNGRDISEAINTANIFTVKLANERQMLNAIYMLTLNRPASDAEYDRIMVKREPGAGGMYLRTLPRVNAPANSPIMTTEFYKDILWAVLNSNEFILNH